MGSRNLLLALMSLALFGAARADAFKCRTPEGRTVISNLPCQPGSKTEAVQASDEIAPERKREADQEYERQRKRLAEREAARAAAEQRDAEARRKLAEEESARRSQCLQSAEHEPDAQLRANLIAACNGVPPQQSVIVQEPILVPFFPSRKAEGPITACRAGDCGSGSSHPRRPAFATKPSAGPPSSVLPATPPNLKDCRQFGGTRVCP